MASEHGRSIAQTILRWLIQRGVIAIPKSIHKQRMVENFAVWDFALSQEDMDRIGSLDMGCSLFFSHTDPVMVRQLGTRRLDL
jgi:2,5-diketo-D-gluconate reductase A